MKTKHSHRAVTALAGFLACGCLVSATAQAAERQVLSGHLTPAVAHFKLQPIGPLPATNQLHLAIGLPLRHTDELNGLLRDLYDRSSPSFRHYLTPDQFAERFGPTKEDYQAVMNFAQRQGFTVEGTHPNRTLLDVKGTVPDIERALHVTMRTYQHPKEAREFYTPDSEPSLDLDAAVLYISGLDNYAPPRPCAHSGSLSPASAVGAANGSGPYGGYMPKDLRAAYAQGIANTGTGQVVGLFELASGYDPRDIEAFETLAGLSSVTVSNVFVDGYTGGLSSFNGEVTLDIDMVIGMAPGVSEVLVYEGLLNPDNVLNRMATDNLAKQLSISYAWGPTFDPLAHQAFEQMAAQGQTIFAASGDSGAYGSVAEPPAPVDDPYVTVAGGTALSMTANGGSYLSETVWNQAGGIASSGGTSVQYAIPSWQQGLNMTANGGSTTNRNMPDVAMPAVNLVIWFEGFPQGSGGTSAAAPLWAAFIALVNQTAQANGQPPVGFLNPTLYTLGQGPNYTKLFHDIATGNNTNALSPTQFKAVPGYDLCTGWGSPKGSSLMHALAVPEPLQITPQAAPTFTGPVGGPFLPASQTYTLANTETGLNWSATTDAAWLALAPTSGALGVGGVTNVTVQLTAEAAALPAGAYTANLLFTNLNDQVVQTRQVTLAIVTAPIITSDPTNTAALAGASATFSVGTATNALLAYQWQFNNGSTVANLTDGGNVSGSAKTALTIANVSPANVGAYSVIVSDAVGSVTSAPASLSLISSLPMILVQPTNLTVLPGASAALSVSAVGDQPFSFAWQRNGTNLNDGGGLTGSASSTLLVAYSTVTNVGAYTVIVSNSLGVVTSSVAMFTVPNTSASGVTLDTLYSFPANNAYGANPYAGLAQGSDGNFFGTALLGGSAGYGTLFKMTTNGAVSLLHAFSGTSNDGYPYGGLVQGTSGFLYGTSMYNGGTIYRVATNGGFVTLNSFNFNIWMSVGFQPITALVEGQDGNYYGTTYYGGSTALDGDYGEIFRVTAGGALAGIASMNNSDGANPSSSLLQGIDGAFYGTAQSGGANGAGTVFRVTTNGQLSALVSFAGTNGAQPVAGLIQDAYGNFFGTTYSGGASSAGTVFELGDDGAFTSLYSLSGGLDGANCHAGLLQGSDGNFYGVTENGGAYGQGTVFRMSPAGALVTLTHFDGFQGAHPEGTLIQGRDGQLYGTTRDGGLGGKGAIFRISLDGSLQITAQPQAQTVFAGDTAIFSVATFGALPVSYQWQKNGTNLAEGGNVSGSNARVLTLTNVGAADPAYYSVVISNSYGTVISYEARLEIIFTPPYIVSGPTNQTVLSGTSASFSVEAAGDGPLFFQWQANGTNLVDGGNISGSATATLTLAPVAATNAGYYSVMVSNALASVQSSSATLTVIPVLVRSAALSSLHSFAVSDDSSNGVFNPFAGVIQAKDGNLYGTTLSGGYAGSGVIYKLTTAGAITILGSFGAVNSQVGIDSFAGLAQGDDGNFYGATFEGGEGGAVTANGAGALFRENARGGWPIPIYTSFATYVNGNNGSGPTASLILGNDGKFYGTTEFGGNPASILAVNGTNEGGYGTIFTTDTNGNLTTLVVFSSTNGAFPVAPLAQGNDGKFYGTTSGGGSNGFGVVFSVTKNGELTALANFDNLAGAYPNAGLVQATDGSFYGTASAGGTNGGWGTVFRMTPDGTLTGLHSFGFADGAVPNGGLVQATDGNLYGTTSRGGVGGDGTVFQITTNGQLTTLVWFDGPNGSAPQASLIQARNGNFYGTTEFGGSGYIQSADSGNGLLFCLTLPMFLSNPVAEAGATATRPFSATLSTQVVRPTGDTVTFAKVSGPAWLTVARGGTLSGTPALSDIGTNIFSVSLTDMNGWVSTAEMMITVVPLPSISLSMQGTNFSLNWAGGQPPYSVQTASDLANPVWQTIAGPLTTNSLLVIPANNAAFYRIQTQ